MNKRVHKGKGSVLGRLLFVTLLIVLVQPVHA